MADIVVGDETQPAGHRYEQQDTNERKGTVPRDVGLPELQQTLRQAHCVAITLTRGSAEMRQEQHYRQPCGGKPGKGEQGDLADRREGCEGQGAVADQTGRQCCGQPRQHAKKPRFWLPACAGIESGGKVLDGVIDRLADQAGTEDEGDEMDPVVRGQYRRNGADDPAGDGDEAQCQRPSRAEEQPHHQHDADE